MLNEFRTLENLFDANVDTLMARLGCTEKVAVLLSLMPSLAKRYLGSKWGKKVLLDNSAPAGELALSLFVGEHVESFYALWLDTQMRLNHCGKVSTGTVDEVVVFRREVVRLAIEHQAANVILVHNHPGGDFTPSNADYTLTNRISEALEIVDVQVIDHIIVAENKYFSFADRKKKHVRGYEL